MPKLLSLKEVTDISTKMTEEYGLAPIVIIYSSFNKSYDSGLKIEVGRMILDPMFSWLPDWFPWFKKNCFVKIKDFYASDFEDLLTLLQRELSKFDGRTKVAEQFRSKYAMQEADKALDEVLRSKS